MFLEKIVEIDYWNVLLWYKLVPIFVKAWKLHVEPSHLMFTYQYPKLHILETKKNTFYYLLLANAFVNVAFFEYIFLK